MDMPAFSRSGNTSQYGKSTVELKAMVPEQIKNEVIALATLQGLTPSEYLREFISMHLHGGVPEDLRAIVWAHVCRETECEYLRAMLHQVIFGVTHEFSVSNKDLINRAEIRRPFEVAG